MKQKPQALAILSLLLSVQLHEEDSLPPSLSFKHFVVKCPADGRCFWSALWLATQASPTQLWAWAHRSRNTTGFAQGGDIVVEKNLVWDWLKQYLNDMSPSTKNRVQNSIPATVEDHVSWFLKYNFLWSLCSMLVDNLHLFSRYGLQKQ